MNVFRGMPRLPLVQRKVKPDGEDVRRIRTLFFARAVLDEAGSPHFAKQVGEVHASHIFFALSIFRQLETFYESPRNIFESVRNQALFVLSFPRARFQWVSASIFQTLIVDTLFAINMNRTKADNLQINSCLNGIVAY